MTLAHPTKGASVSFRVVLRTRSVWKLVDDDCRYGTGTRRFACPRRKTSENVRRGARGQSQVQGSGTVASRRHLCRWCRKWSWLPVRARVSTPRDIGTPCSTGLVYPTWWYHRRGD